MRPLEYIQKGGQKYREFALRRLSALTTLRRSLRLQSLRKHWKVGTSLISVRSSEFGDVIRITAGGESSLVARTGAHEWTFFGWDLITTETFDASVAPYAGTTSPPGVGTELCSGSGAYLMVGRGNDPANDSFIIVKAAPTPPVNPGDPPTHDAVSAEIPYTDVWSGFATSVGAGFWYPYKNTGFQFWGPGTDPGDFPFTGEGWLQTIVDNATGAYLSQIDVIDADASVLGAANIGDLPDGRMIHYDGNIHSNFEAGIYDPLGIGSKPEENLTFSSSISQDPIKGVPSRIWRSRINAAHYFIDWADYTGAVQATYDLGTADVPTWIATDDAHMLLITNNAGTYKAWRVEPGTDAGGAPALTVTEVSTTGNMAYILGKAAYWAPAGANVRLGAGIHLINRQF